LKLTASELLHRIAALPETEQAAAVEALTRLVGGRQTRAALELEAQGWHAWVTTLFPSYAHAPFAFFHSEFWEWCWSVASGVASDPFALIWFRGAAKSTSMQLGTVSMGARGTRRYAWYISDTQEQSDKHLLTIGNLLAASSIERTYPDLAQKRVNKYGSSEGWRRNRYRTAAGFTIDALGLDTAARGGKLEEQRPDLMIFDDIDGKHDSASVTAKKLEIISTTLLPAGSPDLVVMFGQNLITKNSIASRIVDGRADLLAGARISGPYPALRGLQYLRRAEGRGHEITAGTPLWQGFDLADCQQALDREGLDGFLRERMNQVDLVSPGALFSEFDERLHVITDTELIEGYARMGVRIERDERGRAIMPEGFLIARAQDYGTTLAHPCVTGWYARPAEIHPFHDLVFSHRELVRPDWLTAKDNLGENAVTPLRIAQEMYEMEMRGLERHRVRLSLFSHEQSAAFNAYHYDVPQLIRPVWHKWKPDARQGIVPMQNYLQVDYAREHPFRRYPAGHPQAGEPLMGYTRLLLVVADGQGELEYDALNDRLTVRAATDADGLARARWEIPQYRNVVDSQGDEHDRPNRKRDDDWVDQARAVAEVFFVAPQPMTPEERVNSQMKKELQIQEVMKHKGQPEFPDLYMAHRVEKARVEKKQKFDYEKTYQQMTKLIGGNPVQHQRYRRNGR
jgi:hypothetical protein